MSSNDVSFETFKNNKQKTYVVGYIIMGLMIMAVSAAVSQNGGAMIGVSILGLFAGGYLMYLGYETLVDPKNERRCDISKLGKFTNMEIPEGYLNGDINVDTDVDMDEYEILMKTVYGNYGGVFLKSNNNPQTAGGKFDAWYIPGNAKSVLSKKVAAGGLNVAERLYIVTTGDKRVVVRDRDSPIGSDGFRARLFPLSPSPKPFISACDPDVLAAANASG